MNPIELKSEVVFDGDVKELKNKFEKSINSNTAKDNFHNTRASLNWIIRGSLDYFDKLDSDFLGKGNVSGIPSMKADHFANNFYRLRNALEYYCDLQKINFDESEEWELLKDIRTLIVHSGEQVAKVISSEFKEYKAQLGRILKKDECKYCNPCGDIEFDYCIETWLDKHDKSKNRPKNEVDYDNNKENFLSVYICLRAKDVRNIVLTQIKKIIDKVGGKEKKNNERKELPSAVKSQVVEKLDFDKLEELIKNKEDSGYYIENGEINWNGFGLKRLWEYVVSHSKISEDVRMTVKKVISNRLAEYWKEYNANGRLPTFDIRDVFKEYTPDYQFKGYLEGEKFLNIAPAFNRKNSEDTADIDYLLRFIFATQGALETQLDLKNGVNGVICDYFVKSVEMKLREGAKINER